MTGFCLELTVMTDSVVFNCGLTVRILIVTVLGLTVGESAALAQFAGGGQGGGNQGNNLGGIAIDAAGVVSPAFAKETTARLNQMRRKPWPPSIFRQTSIRLV